MVTFNIHFQDVNFNYESNSRNYIIEKSFFLMNFGKHNKLFIESNFLIMKNPRIKNEAQYEALLRKGYSKEKSARIANTPDAGEKGGKAKPYEEWTKEELYQQAKRVGISGRSSMNKMNLIHSLRTN